jgi:hypothetical protein
MYYSSKNLMALVRSGNKRYCRGAFCIHGFPMYGIPWKKIL